MQVLSGGRRQKEDDSVRVSAPDVRHTRLLSAARVVPPHFDGQHAVLVDSNGGLHDAGLAASEVIFAGGIILPFSAIVKSAVLLTHRDELRVIFFDDFAGIYGTVLALAVLLQMIGVPEAVLTLTLVSATDVGVLSGVVVEITFV